MIVVKVEKIESNFKVVVRQGDESVARQESGKAAISAEAARLSEVAAGQSEAVAIQNATQTGQDAAAALASRNQAASSASDAAGSAFDANASAVASEDARGLAVDAQGVASTQAQNSSASAGQSAGSAAAAEAAKNLILNKAEVNLTTAGHVLRADGTLFKSISEVEFLQNKDAFKNNYLSAIYPSKQILFWDNFDRPNGAIGNLDSGQTWENLVGTWTIVNKTAQCNQSLGILGIATTNLSEGIEITANISGAFSGFTSIFYLIKDLNNFMSIEFLNVAVNISQSINGVTTLLSSYPQSTANTFQLASITAIIQINAQNRTITAGIKNYSTIAPPTIVNYSPIFTGTGYYGYGHNQRLNARGQLFTIVGRKFTFSA